MYGSALYTNFHYFEFIQIISVSRCVHINYKIKMLLLRPWNFINHHVYNIISSYYKHICTHIWGTHIHTHLFYFIMFHLAFSTKEKLITSMLIWEMYEWSGKWLKAVFLEALSGLFHNYILPGSYNYNKLPQHLDLKMFFFSFFFHSSKDQKSSIGTTGLKSMCQWAVLPGEILGENLFLAFPAARGC